MSGERPDRGWWLATDGKWYPPEMHPDYGGRIDNSEEEVDDQLSADEPYETDADDGYETDQIDDIGEHEIEHRFETTSSAAGVVATVPDDQRGDEAIETAEIHAPEVEAETELPNAPTAEHHVIGLDPDAGLAEKLLELSDRRVAGLLSDDEFAEAQRQLLTGD